MTNISRRNLAAFGPALLLLAFAPACRTEVADAGPDVTLRRSAASKAVSLGTSGSFAILSKSGVASVPPAAITGDLGVSPIAATGITGLSLTLDASNVFSTSPQVVGRVYAASYAAPTPSRLTAAIKDMETAFRDAAGRTPSVTELGAGNIGGMTLVPGVYKWSTALLIPTDVTLTGSSTSVWIFEIAQGMTVSNAARIVLSGGAQPKNVFWQVGSGVSLGTTAHLEGIVLAKTAIRLDNAASVNGRLLSQTAVTLINSTVTQPAN